MSELLPAAQAVLSKALCVYDDETLYVAPAEKHAGMIAAAALRAAVREVSPDKTIEDIDYVHQSYIDGYKDALYEILIIANQIEIQWAEPLTDSDIETLAKAFSVTRIDFGANYGLS